MRQHSSPIIVFRGSKGSADLQDVTSGRTVRDRGYDEAFIRDFVLEHPETLPLKEIDPTVGKPIPLCDELSTPAGPIDAVMITREGMPIIIECKLWQNPQARREVVGQIIDYAKEIRTWSYEDLQRAVAQRVGTKKFNLFEFVCSKAEIDLDEIDFVDAVTRNLQRGRFALLIVGDGIRTDVEAMSEYLSGSRTLEFTFGLIELPIYELPDDLGRLVTPRVLAKTAIVDRMVVRVSGQADEDSTSLDSEETDTDPVVSERQKIISAQNKALWSELLSVLDLDDTGQEVPDATDSSNIFFMLPAEHRGRMTKDSWITLYVHRSKSRAGMFATGTVKGIGGEVFRNIATEQHDVLTNLGNAVEIKVTDDGKVKIGESWDLGNLEDPRNRKRLAETMASRANQYVNYFRPKVAALARKLG